MSARHPTIKTPIMQAIKYHNKQQTRNDRHTVKQMLRLQRS
jgi:hypothetical protein